MVYNNETLIMSDSGKNIFHSWVPEKEVRACVVLSHGMCEHALRYGQLAEVLTEKGFALFA